VEENGVAGDRRSIIRGEAESQLALSREASDADMGERPEFVLDDDVSIGTVYNKAASLRRAARKNLMTARLV
jgi:hypothetical protein